LIASVNGFHAKTGDEFERALSNALNTSDRAGLINIELRAVDTSPAMRHLRARISHQAA
jgi:hypothetical protein